MYEADAEEAAGFFHVEMLGEIERVVVSIPGEEAPVAEFGGESERRLVGGLIDYAEGDAWDSARRSGRDR